MILSANSCLKSRSPRADSGIERHDVPGVGACACRAAPGSDRARSARLRRTARSPARARPARPHAPRSDRPSSPRRCSISACGGCSDRISPRGSAPASCNARCRPKSVQLVYWNAVELFRNAAGSCARPISLSNVWCTSSVLATNCRARTVRPSSSAMPVALPALDQDAVDARPAVRTARRPR